MSRVIESFDETALPAPPPHGRQLGARIDVRGVHQTLGRRDVLHDVSLTVAPGELVALVGASGAGKTTLLETMAGLRVPTAGVVQHDGVAAPAAANSGGVGYVPQDDIIHRELPLRRTLRYAAGLRLPGASSVAAAHRVVDETLGDLGLAERADVRVGDLSGGQRKRASIAVEVLTRPRALFLDEPTSGLDPSTAAEVLEVVRRLADEGVTVVLTTHSAADVAACDRVVLLAPGGRLAFAGSPAEARRHFGVSDLAHVYRKVAVMPPTSHPAPPGRPAVAAAPPPVAVPRVAGWRQWWLLSRRTADVITQNRLTLAVLVGSPVLVTAMMAVLFRPGAFDGAASPLGPVQLSFWLAFDGFFFGLTYGLLQIVGELPIFRRERLAGLRPSAYVAAKVTVLAPLLVGVTGGLVVVLRTLHRLPPVGWGTEAALVTTLFVEALAALALGLLASALVDDAAQATLALPMLCFPQVLFAGAVVPVGELAPAGRAISVLMMNRWAFESIGQVLRLDTLAGRLPTVQPYGDAFGGAAATGWAILGMAAAGLLAATVAVLRWRTRPGQLPRHRSS